MEITGERHAQAALRPGKEPPATLDRRLGGPQSRSGHCTYEQCRKMFYINVLNLNTHIQVSYRPTNPL
jgi:hypothetical protein